MQLQIPYRTMQDSSLLVRWCFSEQEQGRIFAYSQDHDMYALVIAVHDESMREVRSLVHVGDIFTHIVFPKPGEWRIYAGAVCWMSKNPIGTTRHESGRDLLRLEFLEESDNTATGYKSQVMYKGVLDDVERFDYTGPAHFILWQETPISVDVPQELFAKEPPEWEKKWVTALWSSPVRDQCDYRQRRMFAYTLQPFVLLGVLLFWTFVRLACVIFLVATGFWNLRWSRILHHPLNPPVHLYAFLLTRERNVYVRMVNAIRDRVSQSSSQEERARRIEEKKVAQEARQAEKERQRRESVQGFIRENFSCDRSLDELSLPASGKIRLIFHGIKNKVCRPMAR